jgi:quinol monooxygenase YgiN
MIVLAGTFRFDPTKMEAARPAVAAIIAGSRAEEGCVEFSFAQDVADPALVRVFEVWRDGPALDAHKQTPHFKDWVAAREAIGMHDRQLALYEVSAITPVP